MVATTCPDRHLNSELCIQDVLDLSVKASRSVLFWKNNISSYNNYNISVTLCQNGLPDCEMSLLCLKKPSANQMLVIRSLFVRPPVGDATVAIAAFASSKLFVAINQTRMMQISKQLFFGY